ncbi:MAG TPA: DinB family protein [Acidimicrobiia bacterium]|nr:DinB family protein [Acidimicrobiia bacterium]
MDIADLLGDAFDRVHGIVHGVVEGLEPDLLAARPDEDGNSIAWLIWHLTRIQDDHVASVAGQDQVWTASGWFERFRLPLDASDTGYGHSPDEVAAVRAGADTLLGYFDEVHAATARFVEGLSARDLDGIVDENWDPPVTLGIRLVSVIADDLQHAGQAAYARGLLTGAT